VALVFIGSAYIAYISEGIAPRELWVSWTMFVAAIALNLYFLYSITILRGYGDVAGENIAKTFAKVFQLVLSAVLLLAGFGLVGAAFGYFTNSVLLRAIALWRVKRHREIEGSRQADAKKVTCLEIREVLKAVYHLAWRDGVVQLAYYASSQATTIMSSLYLGLAETGTYSILLQLGTAVYSFAVAYPKSFFPAMQSAFSNGDTTKQLKIVSKGVVAYWGLIVVAALGVLLVILPLLPLFKPDVVIDNLLFLGIVAYLALLQQHSVFCNYIISMNEIPYMKGYLFAAVLGVVLVYLFCAIFNWGAWGIVAGQFLSQIVYNNWKWPKYLCNKLGTTYFQVIKQGIKAWLKRG
jgi:O-antigen/teichoic acid export membrane protein